MAKHNSLNELFTATANAIRSKTGSTDPIVADDFPSAIEGIEAGSGGGVVVCEETEVTKATTIDKIKDLRLSLPNATSIGGSAFSDCTSLTSISIPVATSIEEGAFGDCTSLTSVNLPAATSIGRGAFNDCTSLTSVDLPVATSIGEQAFWGCSLTSVDLPAATDIGEDAFRECVTLTRVDLPAATSIGRYAFMYCSALTSVNLPAATSIGGSAFSDCTSLTSISIPVATSIEEGAFSHCTSLTSISIPVATGIRDNAFWNCPNLSTLILRNPETVCHLIVTAILGTKIVTAEGAPTGEGFIYVPTALYEGYVELIAYQAAQLVGDAATAEYIARAVLRKIEDYPEICGTTETT